MLALADRHLYELAKLDLARRDWKYVQHYADAKTGVVAAIMALDRAERNIEFESVYETRGILVF